MIKSMAFSLNFGTSYIVIFSNVAFIDCSFKYTANSSCGHCAVTGQ